MKALAWYTIIFNLVLIVLFLMTSAKMIEAPPFSWAETITWIIFTLPVIFLGIKALKQSK